MRRFLPSFALAGAALLLAPPVQAVTEAELVRAVGMLFAGDPGAAGGDVNADGRANAADVCGTLQGERSPTQPGPFGIGVQRMTFTKQSESSPGQARQLNTVIWYPTEAGAAPVDPLLAGVVGAPLAGDAPRPLLLFSHGSCGTPTQSLFLTPLLASYGFVVAAPPHPGNTIQDFPSCGTPVAQLDSFINRVADVRFVTDSLLALAADETSFFFGAIDPSRIGMSGHSFGGQTTLRVCAADDRVLAGLALAPAMAAIDSVVPTIEVPVMVQGGELDSVTPYAANALRAYNLLESPKQLVEILDTGHFAFSDVCFPGSGGCGPEDLTQAEAHVYVLRYAVPYVLTQIAGDHRFDAFLEPASAPPGVVLGGAN